MKENKITSYQALTEEAITHRAEVIHSADPRVLAVALSAVCKNHDLCMGCPLFKGDCILQAHPLEWIDKIQ